MGGREVFTASMDGMKKNGGEKKKDEQTHKKLQNVCTQKGFGLCLNFSTKISSEDLSKGGERLSKSSSMCPILFLVNPTSL